MLLEMLMVMVMETYRGYSDGEGLFSDSGGGGMYGNGMALGDQRHTVYTDNRSRSSHEGCKLVPLLHHNVTYYGVIK